MSAQTTTPGHELDLDAARAARKREGAGITPSLRLNGQSYELPVELPVDVFDPLVHVDVDVSLLVRMAMDAREAAEKNDENANMAVLDVLVDLMVANPQLPVDLVGAVKESSRLMLGEECYAALVAFRPTVADLGAIAKHLFRQYGVGLGEALPSSDSSGDTETTSKPTSSGTARARTSGAAGKPRARRAS